jgi:hypothetical protein
MGVIKFSLNLEHIHHIHEEARKFILFSYQGLVKSHVANHTPITIKYIEAKFP